MAVQPETWAATVRALEDGLFVRRGELVPDQIRKRFSLRPLDGIPSPTAFFRVRVDFDLATRSSLELWLVHTATPLGDRELPPGTKSLDEAKLNQVRSALAVSLPGATLCFTTEDREGSSQVIGDPLHAPAIAAAVAAVKYYASWDESDPIDVTVSADRFLVSVSVSGKEYRAIVRTPPRGSRT